MFCQNCGKEVGENERFCSNCGAKLGGTREEGSPVQPEIKTESYVNPDGQQQSQAYKLFPPEEKPDSSKKIMTWVIVGAVSLFGLIVLIILVVLAGASRRKAQGRLDQWKNQYERDYEYTNPFGNDYDYDYDDYDDYYDYYDYDYNGGDFGNSF